MLAYILLLDKVSVLHTHAARLSLPRGSCLGCESCTASCILNVVRNMTEHSKLRSRVGPNIDVGFSLNEYPA